MHPNDFEPFRAILQKCAVAFGKKLTDPVVDSYWSALKDEPLGTVERLATQHIRYQKFFPKPVELRPKEEKPVDAKDETERKFRICEDACLRALEDQRVHDPEGWLKRLPKGSGIERLAALHGPQGIRFDIPQRCWRLA